MLNPSTATAANDDQTIRRVVALSRAWGHGSAVVVNLFALMATRPQQLSTSPAPVGPDNDSAIEAAVTGTAGVIVAWGSHGSLRNPESGVPRADEVMARLDPWTHQLMSLGRTRSGQPRHPLYVRRDTIPTPF